MWTSYHTWALPDALARAFLSFPGRVKGTWTECRCACDPLIGLIGYVPLKIFRF